MMFDNPGKRLREMEDEIWETEPSENLAVDFDDIDYDEDFDENDAVLAREERRPGLRTLVLLMVVAAVAAAAWWLGWI